MAAFDPLNPFHPSCAWHFALYGPHGNPSRGIRNDPYKKALSRLPHNAPQWVSLADAGIVAQPTWVANARDPRNTAQEPHKRANFQNQWAVARARYAQLMQAIPIRPNDRGARAAERVRDNEVRRTMDVFTRIRYHGVLGEKKHGSLLVFGPITPQASLANKVATFANGEGLPKDTALDFMEWEDSPAGQAVFLDLHAANTKGGMTDSLIIAIQDNFRAMPLPARFKMKVEIMITVEKMSERAYRQLRRERRVDMDRQYNQQGRPDVFSGDLGMQDPMIFTDIIRTVTPLTVYHELKNTVAEFGDWTSSTVLRQGSGYAWKTLVSAMVWVRRTEDGALGVGGSLYGGKDKEKEKDKTATDIALEAGLHPDLAKCRGLVLNNPKLRDECCVARSIVTALDPVVETWLDVHPLSILSRALEGSRKRHTAMQKLLDSCTESTNPRVRLNRTRATFLAGQAVRKVEVRMRDVASMLETQGRKEKSDSADIRSRYTSIERSLMAAFKGDSGVQICLSDPMFKSSLPLKLEVLEHLRAAVRSSKPPIKFTFWAPTDEQKIGVIYTDRPTLEFVLNGGRVVNLLFAERHCSLIRSVNACTNHDTRHSLRLICPLCGHHVAANTTESAWRIYQHQERKCSRLEGMKFADPTSGRNLRQLDRHEYRAFMRPALMGTLASFMAFGTEEGGASKVSASVGLWAALPGADYNTVRWLGMPLQDTPDKAWEEVRKARFMHTADTTTIGTALESAAPFLSVTEGEEDPVLHVLQALLAKEVLENICAQLDFKCPAHPDAKREAALSDVCYFCDLPLDQPSKWTRQAARHADAVPARTEDALEDEDAPEEEDSVEPLLEDDVARTVTCRTSGAVFAGHAVCAKYVELRLVPSVVLLVDTQETLARCAEVLCSKEVIETVAGGRMPSLSSYDAGLGVLELRASCSKGDVVLQFRTRATMFAKPRVEELSMEEDDAQKKALRMAEELVDMCEYNYKTARLFPLAFPTFISFSRGVLYRSIQTKLEDGLAPTTLVTKAGYDHASRLLTGGRIVLGEFVEWPPLEFTPTKHRFLFDFTAEYPSQLLRPLPCFEHLDALVHDFTHSLTEGIRFIKETPCDNSNHILRVEVSGAFPPELHGVLGKLCPVQSRMLVKGKHLSLYQRTQFGMDPEMEIGVRSVAHFFPVEKTVVFLRTAKLWERLGFLFTEVATVYKTPAAPWAEAFATTMQTRRRLAAVRGDAKEVEATKLLSNSVIGSLNMNPSKFTNLVCHKTYIAEDGARMSTEDQLNDDPRFTLREHEIGDLSVYEFYKRSWWHKAQTLTFAYIQEMARCDLLELWYGNEKQEGLKDFFPEATIGYGCTDSLCVELELSEWGRKNLFSDVRHELLARWGDRFDTSNVPLESTFWTTMPERLKTWALPARERNQGKWGSIKDETALAGIHYLIVNGPNRWAYRTNADVEADSSSRDVLKSLPRAWEGHYTVEDYAASWYAQPEESMPVPLPVLDKHGKELKRKAVSLWANTSCIVSRTPPFCQWPLGSQAPEAQKALSGELW